MKLPIYLDHHATTPIDPRVLEVMLPYFIDNFGNAASIDHEFGNQARRAVEESRSRIGAAINAEPEEIIFTSGATEADNLAILGVAQALDSKGKHIITSVTEHKAVLDTCKYLESKGWEVTYLPVDQYGIIDPDDVRKAITPRTILISIMAANNEIGVVAPIVEIGKIAHENEVYFHTDATQAVGYLKIDVQKLHIDLLSMSGHKIYGPKGVGALYVRGRHPRVRLVEQVHGGGHERGMRSGTLNVPGIVGFAKALDICNAEMNKELKKLSQLRNTLLELIQTKIEKVQLNGHPTQRLPHNLNLAIDNVESRSLLVALKNRVAFSTGSACTTAHVEPSHVIQALGFGVDRAHSSVRFGLGRYNTIEEIIYVANELSSAVTQLRKYYN